VPHRANTRVGEQPGKRLERSGRQRIDQGDLAGAGDLDEP